MSDYSKTITNPTLKKLSAAAENSDFIDQNRATYKGIAAKTIYFMLVFSAGMGAYFYVDNYYSKNSTGSVSPYGILLGVLIISAVSGFAASLFPNVCAAAGTIYAAGEGYAVTWLSMSYGKQYKGIIIGALALTVLLITVMSVLYATGTVTVTNKLRTVLISCVSVSIIGSIAYMLLGFFAPASELYITITVMTNGVVGGIFSVIGVAVASLLLICDFDFVAQTVEHGLDKKYEWYASYGMVVGIIYLYLKVIRLLAIILGRRNNN